MRNQKTKFEHNVQNYTVNELEKPLSEREIQVLELMVAGKSNPQIAKILYISLNTVKAHSERIYEKLCVKNRAQAAVKAVKMGIIK